MGDNLSREAQLACFIPTSFERDQNSVISWAVCKLPLTNGRQVLNEVLFFASPDETYFHSLARRPGPLVLYLKETIGTQVLM